MGTVTAGTNATATEYNDVVYLNNYIMNSNFNIWQRGVSVGLSDTTVTYLADRWGDYHNKDGGTLPTLTRSRETLTAGDIPNSFYYSRLTTNGTGTSLGTASLGIHYQLIEHGTRLLCGDGKKVTVTYYARSSITSKKLGVYLRQNYGTTGSPTAVETINGYNDTLSSGWVKYTHTFTTNTLVGKTFGTDNNDCLEIGFQYMWGTDSDDRVGAVGAVSYEGSGTIDIAQVQVTIGDTSMEYKPLSYADELAQCQRYCYVNGSNATHTSAMVAWGWAGDNTTVEANIAFPVQMRTFPTLTATGSDWVISDRGSGAIDCTGISLSTSVQSTSMAMVRVTTAGHTQYRPYAICADGTAGRLLILSAEL